MTEKKGSVPVRQHFVLPNARYLSLPVSLSFIAQGGRPLLPVYITLILCPFGQRYSSILSLPNTCYLGFDSADLYLPIYYTTRGVPMCKGRFTHATHGLRLGTVFFTTACGLGNPLSPPLIRDCVFETPMTNSGYSLRSICCREENCPQAQTVCEPALTHGHTSCCIVDR